VGDAQVVELCIFVSEVLELFNARRAHLLNHTGTCFRFRKIFCSDRGNGKQRSRVKRTMR
jgi:hypothetical protein